MVGARSRAISGNSSSIRTTLREREPTRCRASEAAGGYERIDHRPLHPPGEPRPRLILVRDARGAAPKDEELVERDVLRGAPRLAPHLVPAGEHARVAVSA